MKIWFSNVSNSDMLSAGLNVLHQKHQSGLLRLLQMARFSDG